MTDTRQTSRPRQVVKVATFRYDTTDALFDGTDDGAVRFEGPTQVELSTAQTLPEIFASVARGETDVAELGLTFYLRSLERDGVPVLDPALIAIPVFPARVFRHSSVFVNTAAGITSPMDLAGKRVGEFGTYGQDSGIWAKGILADEYGFDPAASRWVIGGLDQPMPPFDFTTLIRPDGVEIDTVEDRALGDMLERGEIDALFTSNVPQCVLDGSPQVARLFGDYETVERDWYQRTGIFPMMHTLVARRDLITQTPGLAQQIYEAFDHAKDIATDRYRHSRRLYQVTSMLPWTNQLFEENRALMGEDWWPYGLSANRIALETFTRFHHEQGLSSRQWALEDIFAPELLDT